MIKFNLIIIFFFFLNITFFYSLLVQAKNHIAGISEENIDISTKPQAEFYKAFKIKAKDKMYLKPKERVSIW